MRILITGASGLLGQELCPILDKEGHQYWATNSKIFDITNTKLVNEIMEKVSLDLIIHLAAYTNIDQAEVSKDEAFLINHIGTKNMAKIAKKLDVPIVYISSDAVFDGEKSNPYTTEDKANPINVYGLSKLMGENEIRKSTKKYYIIRTSSLYGKGGKNFVDTMLTFSMLSSELSVVDDQILCPTWTRDLAYKIVGLINDKMPYGTYHMCSSGEAKWSELTRKIFEIKKRNVCVSSIEKSDFPRPAKRPRYSVMDNKNMFPHWEESLEKYLLSV